MKTKKMVLCALMGALLCVTAPFSIPVPFSPVPVTLATFILYLTVFLLTKKQAVCACLVYLAAGMAGLPVFAGFMGGFSVLAGPTGGYLAGYVLLVWSGAFFVKCFPKTFIGRIASLTAAMVLCYLFGTLWFCVQMQVGIAAGFAMAVLPYLPFEFCKIVAAASAGPKIAAAVRQAG